MVKKEYAVRARYSKEHITELADLYEETFPPVKRQYPQNDISNLERKILTVILGLLWLINAVAAAQYMEYADTLHYVPGSTEGNQAMLHFALLCASLVIIGGMFLNTASFRSTPTEETVIDAKTLKQLLSGKTKNAMVEEADIVFRAGKDGAKYVSRPAGKGTPCAMLTTLNAYTLSSPTDVYDDTTEDTDGVHRHCILLELYPELAEALGRENVTYVVPYTDALWEWMNMKFPAVCQAALTDTVCMKADRACTTYIRIKKKELGNDIDRAFLKMFNCDSNDDISLEQREAVREGERYIQDAWETFDLEYRSLLRKHQQRADI